MSPPLWTLFRRRPTSVSASRKEFGDVLGDRRGGLEMLSAEMAADGFEDGDGEIIR